MNIRIGSDVRRKEDLRLVTGAGCFSDDVDLPGQAYAVMVRSPHAHARIRSIDTTEARATDGVLAVLTGADLLADGLKPIPHRPMLRGAPDITLRNRDSSDADHHAALPAAGRQGPLRRRSGGDGGRHIDRRRQDRRRARRRGLRAARCGHAADGLGRGRRAFRVQGRHQYLRRRRRGRRRRHRSGVQARRAYRLARYLGAARHRRADGAARRGRRLRCPHRPLYALCRQRQRGAAEDRARGHPWRRREHGARDRARRRRQFRHPQRVLSGVRAGVLGVAAARAAGEMDLRAQRVLPERLPGPRPRGAGGARARRRRPLPGAARHEHQQCRRPHRELRRAGEGRRADVERLQDPGRAFPRPRGALQHRRRPIPIAAPAAPRRCS